jgi:hypothetical protein
LKNCADYLFNVLIVYDLPDVETREEFTSKFYFV